MIQYTSSPGAVSSSITDIYYHPKYGQTAELIDGGTWECAYDPTTDISFSYVRREIEALPGHYDTVTPYGYGGLSAPPTTTAEDLIAFRRHYLANATDRGLVAELARLNPLDDPQPFLLTATKRRHRTTYGSYVADIDDEAARVSGKYRTAIRRSERLGLEVEERNLNSITSKDHPFRRIYLETMERVQARDSLRLDDEYFRRLTDLPAGSARLILATHRNEVVAGAIFLLWDRRVHYHLSCSSSLGRELQATSAIIEHAKRFLLAAPFHLHLGGGREDGDGLSKFKRRCSTATLAMIVTETVTNDRAFEYLSEGHGNSAFFPPYRSKDVPSRT